jgi:hypothetical protein
MWSVLFITLFSVIQPPITLAGLAVLLLTAATPASLIVYGVLLQKLSFVPPASHASAPKKSRSFFAERVKAPHLLVVIM